MPRSSTPTPSSTRSPFVPAAVARERERVGAYAERTAGGGLLSDVLVEEVRRSERLVAIDDEAALICPWASRSPFELRVIPRSGAASFAEDNGGAAMIHTALRLLAARFDELSGAQPLGPHRAARHRALPLARRHRAAADDQGGLRARHRRRHQHLPSRAGRRRPARVPLMPPNPRPIPRFIADSTQEGIPHGRFAERLGEAFREACRRDRGPARRRRAARRARLVPRARLGRPRLGPVLGTGRGRRGCAGALRPRLLRPAAEQGEPSELRAKADFTDVLAEDNAGLENRPQRRRDRPLARRERPRRRGHPRLGPPSGPRRRRRHRRARRARPSTRKRSPTAASP